MIAFGLEGTRGNPCLYGEMEEDLSKVASSQARIRTWYLSTRSLERYRYAVVIHIDVRIMLKWGYKVKVKLPLCFDGAPRHGGVSGEWRYSSTH